MNFRRTIPFLSCLLLLGCWLSCASLFGRDRSAFDFGDSFYVDYSAHIEPKRLALATTSIVHTDAETDFKFAHGAGCKVLAYLSVVEVAPDAKYRNQLREKGVPVLSRNEIWKSDIPDITAQEWENLLLAEAERAAAKGFDGFFLDTVDSVDLLAQKFPARAREFRQALVDTIRILRERYPDKAIVSNRGFSILDGIAPLIDAVLVESLFQTYFFDKKEYGPVPEADRSWLLGEIAKVQAHGLPVMVLDYVSPDAKNSQLALDTARKIREKGFLPFISTPELFGESLAPIRQVPRKVAAIFGRVLEEESGGAPFWPADTWIAQFLQLPLEWLGYEVVYLDAIAGDLPALDESYAAIVTDMFTDWPTSVEKSVLQWLVAPSQRTKKLLVFGKLPFEDRMAVAFGKLFGMQINPQTMRTQNTVVDLRIAESPIMRGEFPLRPIPYNFPAITAPAHSEILVSSTFTVPNKTEHFPCDAIFIAPWGAMALNPFVRFERPDNFSLWGIDPFAFLEAALHDTPFPAPDPTTRDGKRLFFVHIDADGFSNKSEVSPGKYSSEVIRDEIYKKYPIPITSSIIEAEIRGYLKYQKDGDSEVMKAIARDIFALPNIHISSHTFTHPFYWMANDKTATMYEVQSLELGDEYSFKTPNPEREIRDSIRFIREELAPPDKPVDLILWSGNCRPGPEAIAIADEMGIENMNGGDTVISRRRPSLSAVAPLSMQWGERLQIYAAVQNEMLFTNRFQGPRWGGFVNVIETFERTETPRRLKPVNIYFHMFIADRLESLQSLRTVFDWAVGQPLQATTAAEYARMVRQSRKTLVFTEEQGGWVVVHGSKMRTFRLPDSGLRPDLSACRNVIGWNVHEGQLYITTNRATRTRIVLSPSPQPHIFLESSTAEVDVSRFSPRSLALTAKDLRPVQIVLGGLKPVAACTVELNGEKQTLTTDDRGKLVISAGENVDLVLAEAPLP